MKDINPRITVGITAYRSGKYLKKAINSLLSQTTNAWNGVLILDGGSDKSTKHAYRMFNHQKFQKYEFNSNVGPFGTRSKAIEISNTEWYFQLDSDDLLPPDSIENIINAIKSS